MNRLDHLRLRGYLPDPLNLSSIIHGLCDANRFNEAHQRLIIFLTSLCVPDERTCNVLIARFLHSKDPFRTFNVIHRLIEFKPELVPSLINYNRLIDQFCSVSLPNVAHRMLYDMINRGHCPNTGMRYEEDQSVNSAAFANLVDCLCREGLFNEVFMIAEEMPQGNRVNEDFAFGHLIDSLCKVGRSHGASRVVYIMRKKGFTPIINGFCKMGRVEEALKVLNDMMTGKFPSPDAVTFTTIISGLLNAGRSPEARNLLLQMLEKGITPGVVTYNAILRGLFKLQLTNEAMAVFDEMISDGVAAAILEGLCRSGHLNEAIHFLYELVDSGVNPNIVSYNIVIDRACSLGMKREAYQIVGEMQKNGLNPDAVTWRTLDKLHVHVKNLI
uniref:Pentacotripeptide-repeat region of PRORP domain-containing protein n=1 Tax=Salix viminalis TaxID=40686 RepID=A0A6N2L402_SALVM